MVMANQMIKQIRTRFKLHIYLTDARAVRPYKATN